MLKRKSFLLVILLLCFVLFPVASAKAEATGSFEPVALNELNFPDANFRGFIIPYDLDADGYLDYQELRSIRWLYMSESNIKSLKGLEFCFNLFGIDCSDNPIESIDPTHFPELQRISFGYCKIKTLDLSNNPKLYIFSPIGNPLLFLDLSNNPKLQDFGEGSFYTSKVTTTSIDTKDIPGFEMSRSSNWENCTINGTIVTIIDTKSPIQYQYDAGENFTKKNFVWEYRSPDAGKEPPWIGLISSFTKTYGDKPFTLRPSTSGGGEKSFSSSNPNVATIDENGTVEIKSVGTTTITLSLSETEEYLAASKDMLLTITKKVATMTGSSSYQKKYGDQPFVLDTKANSDATLRFATDNPNVAVVNQSGVVSLKGAGSANITVTSPQTDTCQLATKLIKVVVSQKIATIYGFSPSYTKTYGDQPFSLNAKTDGGTLTFASNMPNVVKISSNGIVTISGVGTATIKITSSGTQNYAATSQTVSITVKAKAVSISGVASSYNKTYGDRAFTVKPKVSGNRKISFSSSNKRVFIVDSRGKVTIKGCGKARLTLTAASSNGYSRVTKNVTVTVKPKKMAITVSAKRNSFLQITWKRDTKVKGYQICCAKDSKFKKNPVIQNITGSKTSSKTLKRGKGTCYVRVRSYILSGNTKIYSSYSSTKKVTVK